MADTPIKKQVVITVEYGSEWQYKVHHKFLLLLLKTFQEGMFRETNFTMMRHKDNKVELSGDTECPPEEPLSTDL